MEKVSIVILNYLNYKDTIECVQSIFDMGYDYAGIVIVDNHSYNESYDVLCREFCNYEKINVIQTPNNLGFAKGNNVGIAYARENYHTDFVFVVNNDTLFLQKNFFDVLLKEYEEGVGILGPEIQVRNGSIQPKMKSWVTLREGWCLHVYKKFEYWGKGVWLKVFRFPWPDNGKAVELLHGCALLFTQDFFQYYEGFYPDTFLYKEEEFLYLRCKVNMLRQKYVATARIFHKEDGASEISFGNNKRLHLKYWLRSSRQLLWYIVKSKLKKCSKLC